MGFWNDGIRSSTSRPRSRSGSGSDSPRPRSHRAGSTRSTDQHHHKRESEQQERHYSSRPSLARSASSFFSIGGGSQHPRDHGSTTSRGRSSYTSARPRSGFVARVRRFLRQLYDYMRAHPVKVFMLVIMPLITGGALTKLLAVVGIRLPRSVQNMVGSSMNRGVGESERFFARGGARDFTGGSALPGMSGGVGESIQGALNLAKLFM